MDEVPAEMDATEKFMFDLQGYLVVPEFLSGAEVSELNAAFDANWDKRRRGDQASKRTGYDQFYGMLEWPRPYCQPFRKLLAHRKLIAYLNTIFGRGWKIDHEPFMLTGTKAQSDAASAAVHPGATVGGMTVHGGTARESDGAFYYKYANGTIRCGMCNCVYLLRDIAAGDGGVGFVPGSHKANFSVPPKLAASAAHGIMPPVVNPVAKAGALILFSEATLHCTLPWYNELHETRRLLFRYSPKHLHVDGGTFSATQPEWVRELTPAQRAVLEPAYQYHRPEIANDGVRLLPQKTRPTPDGRSCSSSGKLAKL